MKSKLPSSVLVSLYLAVGLTFVFGLLLFISAGEKAFSLPVLLIFFFVTLLVLVAVLEYLVFRRLKSLQLVNQREIKKLKDLEAYRREFLGEVSHELKTPIFAIQGFIHTLMDGAVDDMKVRNKFLKKAMKNSDRLASLVDDLLVITQAESGEIETKIRRFPIYELVTDVVESLERKFSRKSRNITCIVEANGLEGQDVLADHERIEQVLTNLLDNAIKYGNPQGTIRIELRLRNDKLEISVMDDGPGIDPEHLEKIFRRFYRVDKSRSRETGGTGLGLAICKHLLKLHGETISVSSQLGEGTSFIFTLKPAG